MREIPEDHLATVKQNQDGSLVTLNDEINVAMPVTPRKLVSVVPRDTETVVDIAAHRDHFSRLTSINVSLTNACNLSCSYCYEQHRKDYGRFTVDSIQRAHNFLLDINDLEDKNLIFFGGEPLIHKSLILDYLRAGTHPVIGVNMVSNGLLLTRDFIDEYFSYPNTKLILSLDTLDPSVDQRGIGKEKMDALVEMITYMPEEVRTSRITVRPTIGFETALGMPKFLNEIYRLGIRSFIIQPLIMGNAQGFLNWSDDQWNTLTSQVCSFLQEHDDIHVEVTEGVGSRERGNNCLSGYDIISIDPSGDFSGCFFFVNQKDKAGSLISGNIFTGKLFIDREKQFDTDYRAMFATHEQCKSCDLQDHCYQCPAGNLDTGGGMYRPDGMCQRFVKFYLDIQNARFHTRWQKNVHLLAGEMATDGDEAIGQWLKEMISLETSCDMDILNGQSPHRLMNIFCRVLHAGNSGPDEVFWALAWIERTGGGDHTWDELHSLLLARKRKQSIRVPETMMSTPMGIPLCVSLLRTVFYE